MAEGELAAQQSSQSQPTPVRAGHLLPMNPHGLHLQFAYHKPSSVRANSSPLTPRTRNTTSPRQTPIDLHFSHHNAAKAQRHPLSSSSIHASHPIKTHHSSHDIIGAIERRIRHPLLHLEPLRLHHPPADETSRRLPRLPRRGRCAAVRVLRYRRQLREYHEAENGGR